MQKEAPILSGGVSLQTNFRQDSVLVQGPIDELISEHARPLMKYLLYYTRREDIAQDLFQETWMRVLTKGHQFSGKAQFRTWLFAIARNATLDVLRRREHQSLESIIESQSPELLLFITTSDPVCMAPERLAIVKLLMQLAPHYRRTIWLRFYCDMSLEEISIKTQSSLSTVKARLYRGLKQMRTELSTVNTNN